MKCLNSLVLWLCLTSIASACCCCGCNQNHKTDSGKVEATQSEQVLPANEKEAGWVVRFEVYKDDKGEWRWRAKSRNGRITGDSGEGYKNKADCLHGIQLFKNFASHAEVLEK